MSSTAQIAANQANAQLSTGPVSEQGKAAVSKNALKTGLTGRTVLLPTDDAELYARHIETFRARYSPAGDAETELVQSIADTSWRIARIPSLEAGIYAIGRAKLADLHPKEQDPQLRAAMIEAEVFLAYERPLRNLHTQEARLRRHLEKDLAALKELQQTRLDQSKALLAQAAAAFAEAIQNGHGSRFNPAAIGFEFSMAEIEAKLAELQPQILKAYKASRPRHEQKAA